jgi:rod shape-determining protein MreD
VKTLLRVTAFVLAAVVLQSTVARVVTRAPFDLVLVVVVAVALLYGRVAGLASGSLAGLVQDALGGGVLGLSGLGKSIAGYLTGVAATQFIVNQAAPRGLIFAGASVLNAVCFIGLSVLLGLRRYDRPFVDIVIQALVNAAVGVLLFYVIELAPAAKAWSEAVLERRRKRRYH